MTSTMSQLKSLSLSEIKALAKKRKSHQQTNKQYTIQKHRVEQAYYPLSSAQKSIWLLNKKQGNGRAYNNPYAIICQVNSPFLPELASSAVDHIVQQHAIFRTVFTEINGEPVQKRQTGETHRFAYDDFSHGTDVEKRAWLEQAALEEGLRPLDLAQGPLVFFRLIKVEQNRCAILMMFHHIISDGWTVNLFLKAFLETYYQLSKGATLQLTECLQFFDYALYEQVWFKSEAYQKGLSFWCDKLVDVEGQLSIPTNRLRAKKNKHQGSMCSRKIEPLLWQQLQESCKALQVTEFHLFVAAYQLLLHLYSGQEEVIIGVPFANRNVPKSQQIMGVFMNTLPLCATMTADLTIKEVIERAKNESNQSFSYQSIPFSHIVETLPQRHFSHGNPIYQAILTYQIFPFYDPEKIQYEPIKVDYGETKLDLNLWVEAEGDSLLLSMYYNSVLFAADHIEQMMNDLRRVLTWVVQFPNTKIGDLSLLNHSQADAFQEMTVSVKADAKTVCQQFDEQVAQQPQAQALSCEGRSMSYQALDRQAMALACWLKQQGVESGDVVALQLPKNEHYVTAILGIWKANACYLPLDETLSDKQIGPLLSQTKAVLLIGDIPRLGAPIKCLNWHDCPKEITGCENYYWGDNPELAAYILFTSGSTGTPKGVEVTHNQLAHYCDAIRPTLAQKANARYGMFSSFNTDLAHTMMFPALMAGGCLEIISTALLNDPIALCAHLKSNPLDCAKMTPSHLSALLQLENAADILPSQLLVLGGEALTKQLVDKVRDKAPQCRMLNHYGPTETTIGVACYEVPAVLPDELATVPIGQSLNDSQLFVLDPQLKIQAVGIAGEIYITSQHMSNGYLDLPELTSKAFIIHPLLPDCRLYRTGDRGMRLEGGAIVFIGRMDRQVKIRGFRVELAEIECRLAAICGQTVAVLYREGDLDHVQRAQLVAYIPSVNKSEQAQIKQRLAHELPSFMKPDHIEWLERLPLNHSGKVNYRQLAQVKLHTRKVVNLPQTEIEHALHQMFAEILKEALIDTKVSFFELGGNSLNALNLVISINRKFDKNININDFFEYSSIVQLAHYLELQTSSTAKTLICLQKGVPEQRPTLLLVHPAGGNVLCYQNLTTELGGDIPVYAIQVTDFSQLDERDIHIESLASKYIHAAGSVIKSQNLILGGWSLGATIAFEMAQQLHDQEGSLPRLLILDQSAPQVQVDNSSQMNDAQRLAHFAGKVSQFMGQDLRITPAQLLNLDERQRTGLFLSEFKRAGLVPDRLTLDDFAQFIKILQTHIEASEGYSGAVYAGDIIVVEAKEVLKGRMKLDREGLGWQDFSTRPLCHLSVEGDHLSMLNAPNINGLAKGLLQVLV
ncbi:non-ribosomal peptide synthetase [Shewanella surugensis]|uniref:Amino acid adenylation domain-containing protein n=1 Tax=Shewanella surugensis TaxID=212020 RepID=A0ABT0L799_9GAMM|nr:amino acid adenylation domain-containing protein [Shewanella surugensis]MCL1123237.1 amino acid adenylation domain-containing protein [Shewanella surugensis]